MVSTIDASEFFASHARDLLLATAVFPAIFLIYVLRQVIYNIYFHPLSSYPGPKLFAAARLTHLSRLVTGNLTRTVTELHQKYGEVVRIAPDELSFNGPQAWRDIYGHRQGHKGLIKEPKFLGLPPEGVHNIFTTPSDADHSRMRKLLAHAFSERALREQESLITSYIDLLISNLHDQIRGPTQGTVNLVKWYNFTTFDIIGDLSFGESFHCLESGEYHPWIAVIFKAIRFGTILHAARHYPPLTEMLALLLPSHLAEQRKKRSIFNKTKVDTRLKLGTSVDRPDFMSYVLRYNDERGMTVPEIHSNSIILITAGSETTATFLCGVTYHLLRNHEPYQKLLEEVRTSFESEDEINSTTVSQLPYLAAVIEEGLRIYPPVPCTVARVTAPEGIEICGRHVPGNTIVGVNQYAAYHDAANFTRPEEFIPERWLPSASNEGSEFAHDRKQVHLPFSTGPRNCLGRNLAYMEMRIILARMVWNFNMELCEESQAWAPDQKVFILYDKPDLMVRLKVAPTARGRVQ